MMRQRRQFWVAALFCAAFVTATRAQAQAVTAVRSVAITVSNLDSAAQWYHDVLTFEKAGDIVEAAGADVEALTGVFGARVRSVDLRLGTETITLRQFLAPRGRPFPADAHSNDRFFQHVAIVVSDMTQAYTALRAHDVEHASSGPQRLPDWNPNAGGIEAFYFKDPDQHVLEVLHFPAGKGDPRWQNAQGRLFLGIDHTAIVVGDTETSLAFYRDVLGLKVVGGAENYGTEQEHLNNVFGARLKITTLHAATGPGVEFLQYLAPGGGRPYPLDSRSNDLWQWETRMEVGDVPALAARMFAAHVAFVSPGVVKIGDPALHLAAGALVRDPDGHAVMVGR